MSEATLFPVVAALLWTEVPSAVLSSVMRDAFLAIGCAGIAARGKIGRWRQGLVAVRSLHKQRRLHAGVPKIVAGRIASADCVAIHGRRAMLQEFASQLPIGPRINPAQLPHE
jgi:hypothetical protein